MLKRIVAAAAAVSMFFCCLSVCVSAESFNGKKYIVKLKPSDIQLMRAGTVERFNIVDENMLGVLLDKDLIEWYEEDYAVELFDDIPANADNDIPPEDAPTKKYDETKWDLDLISADFIYDINSVGQSVKVGVIDSGIAAHAALDGSLLDGYNYLSGNDSTEDTYGHGTFVGGIIAASDYDGGIIGAAPKTKLVPLKCFEGKTSNVATVCDAIYGAVDDFGCDIINMSFGLSEDSRALKEAIEYAADKGVIMVAAVGNSGNEDLKYPAAYENVIGVGAVDRNGNIYTKSQHNESVFVTAPGVDVKSTNFRGGYTVGTGSSYSTPFVAAAAAAMMNIDEDMDAEAFREVLSVASVDKGDEGYDEYYGYGILSLKDCALKLLDGTPYYISPVEESGDRASAVVYNNTENDFSGQFVEGKYNGKEMKAITSQVLNVSANKTAEFDVDFSEYSQKYFVWNSMEDNTVLSNVRQIIKDEKEEETFKEKLVLSIDLSEERGEKYFSLIVYGRDGTLLHAVQDRRPANDIYELSVPMEGVAEDTETERLCGIAVKALINGKETSIPADIHDFEDTVILPTKAEKGYTEHKCKKCEYKYADNETEAIGYFITYDSNGGENAPERQNKKHGEQIVLSEFVPSRDGYTFVGWSADKEAESPDYEAGAVYMSDEDVTLYALWQGNAYRLIYVLDGAEYKTVQVKCGDKVEAESAPRKRGYAFSGWVGLPDTMPAQDVTVSGSFIKEPISGGRGGRGYAPSVVVSVDSAKNFSEQAEAKDTEQNSDIANEENYIIELFSFGDVSKNDWFYDSVRFVNEKGLMKGTSEEEFAPQAELDRAMFVTILHRMENEPKAEAAAGFSDIFQNAYYADAVDWAVENGIVQGVSETEFAPDEKITREQMAVLIYRYAISNGYSGLISHELAYCDRDEISDFAQNAVKWASAEGILNGDGNCFYPQKTATRAEAAAVFMRLCEKLQNEGMIS